MQNYIQVKGAREHNLKNINLKIPKNKMVVFTGVSGSGKSSLAFDTIYAEGQRRYVESLSTYARQFLGIMDKPDVDSIEGLSPAISIDQKSTSKNPRSTVGTVTEIYDYLRLLYSRIGHPHCPKCGREIAHQSIDQIVDSIFKLAKSEVDLKRKCRFYLLSPVVKDRKGEFTSLFSNLKSKGYQKVRVDNTFKNLSEDFLLFKNNRHDIDVVIDKFSFDLSVFKTTVFLNNMKSRLTDSIQQGLQLSDGNIIVNIVDDKSFDIPEDPKITRDFLFSEKFSCPYDNIQIAEIEPRTFSFNTPHGACPKCQGLGKLLKIKPELIFSKELSIKEGGIMPFSSMFEHDTWYSRIVEVFCRENGIDTVIPIGSMDKQKLALILYGSGLKKYQVQGFNRWGKSTIISETFLGVIDELEKRYRQTTSDYVRAEIEKYMISVTCPDCSGARLKKESLSITIDSLSIYDITNKTIFDLENWIVNLSKKELLSNREIEISAFILQEIKDRLNFLLSVGLDYLSLSREAGSLSGGEAQRIRLASQIGSGLSGVLYVLDEPTIGLHQKDNFKLIHTLKKLRDLGNTVIVVEHDREMIENADIIVDFGPFAGDKGGEVIAQGNPKQIKLSKKSITGAYLRNDKIIDTSLFNSDQFTYQENKKTNQFIEMIGCNQFNLKNINVKFPLGKLVCITGVSGSGKSTLLVDTLYPALKSYLYPRYRGSAGKFIRIEGKENVDKIILIDQSPIGRTPRSNPATYTKVFDPIREVFSQTKDARAMGFKKSRFSFNLKGGRCESCEGQGQNKIEMQFMSDIWITCEVCKGKRYNTSTLDIKYRGKDISEVLNLNVDEAIEFFHSVPLILSKLYTISDVGLGYIKLGQPATQLSGGEAQRVKLSTELTKKSTGNTVYILDEPTTGLHFYDIEKLLKILKLLVKKGNSVILIEHNLDVIKNSDWIIDLGPMGGDQGGKIVAQGSPKEISENKDSFTGQYLSKII